MKMARVSNFDVNQKKISCYVKVWKCHEYAHQMLVALRENYSMLVSNVMLVGNYVYQHNSTQLHVIKS